MPRVAIVIPLFNKARTLERTLRSLEAQSVADWEAVVVDDGSTDSGAELVSRWPDARVRLLRQSNAGPGAARNRGWQSSDAPLVAFLDADDEWERTFLEESLPPLEHGRASLSAVAWLDEPGGQYPQWAKQWQAGEWRVSPETSVRELISRLAFCSPCTSLARRTAIERYGGFFEKRGCRYAEDAHLFLKILLNEEIHFSHRPLARFHREDSALSGNYRAARPVEPFLEEPEDVRACCPPELEGLLERFLSARAMKTSLMLAYWGECERAASLRGRFPARREWKLPWFWASRLVAARPGCRAAAALGAIHRWWKSR